MPRELIVRCDNCGAVRDESRATAETPRTWWLLEDHGQPLMRTGPLDFCGLPCLAAFIADPAVRQVYQLDFLPRAVDTAAADPSLIASATDGL